jgi:hypothetical protein
MSSKARSKSGIVAIAKLSDKQLKMLLEPIRDEIKAGRSSFISAYAGAIHYNDILHSAAIITDTAYSRVDTLSTVFDVEQIGADIFGAIFGNAALKPVLSSLVESGDGGDSDDESKATSAAELFALAKALGTAAV